jgi:hypothetical protein
VFASEMHRLCREVELIDSTEDWHRLEVIIASIQEEFGKIELQLRDALREQS